MTSSPEPAPVDLAQAPLTYPGPIIPASVLLTPDRDRVITPDDDLDAALSALGAAPLADREPVVAVGSNASAGVLRWKLARGGADVALPLVTATVRHLRIGVSAHVSRAGFVPAAPAHRPGEVARVAIGWLDRAQLDCIDRTEPNYRRIRLAAADYPLTPDLPLPVASFAVYESSWGVLGDGAEPLPLPTQPELAAWFAARSLSPWSTHTPESAARALAASLPLREQARSTFRTRGLVHPSALPPPP